MHVHKWPDWTDIMLIQEPSAKHTISNDFPLIWVTFSIGISEYAHWWVMHKCSFLFLWLLSLQKQLLWLILHYTPEMLSLIPLSSCATKRKNDNFWCNSLEILKQNILNRRSIILPSLSSYHSCPMKRYTLSKIELQNRSFSMVNSTMTNQPAFCRLCRHFNRKKSTGKRCGGQEWSEIFTVWGPVHGTRFYNKRSRTTLKHWTFRTSNIQIILTRKARKHRWSKYWYYVL